MPCRVLSSNKQSSNSNHDKVFVKMKLQFMSAALFVLLMLRMFVCPGICTMILYMRAVPFKSMRRGGEFFCGPH